MLLELLVKVVKSVSQQICGTAAPARRGLQLVEEVVEGRHALLQTLAFSRVVDNSGRLRRQFKRITREHLPVVKDTLWECLATCVRA